jgi:hypothetical protein
MSFMEEFSRQKPAEDHAAGTFENAALARLEALLPSSMERTVETGCGKSTILFSNLSQQHTVFCVDDRSDRRSSVRYFEGNPLTRMEKVVCVFGPSQLTLQRFVPSGPLDCVLLDGPHGYPFPELEYFYLYPHLRAGGFLILDDVHIPTIGRMADVLQEDEMFEFVEVVATTAILRRTGAPTFSPTGDGWWTQSFNRRRIPESWEVHCGDGKMRESFADRFVSPAPIRGIGPRLRRAARVLLRGR